MWSGPYRPWGHQYTPQAERCKWESQSSEVRSQGARWGKQVMSIIDTQHWKGPKVSGFNPDQRHLFSVEIPHLLDSPLWCSAHCRPRPSMLLSEHWEAIMVKFYSNSTKAEPTLLENESSCGLRYSHVPAIRVWALHSVVTSTSIESSRCQLQIVPNIEPLSPSVFSPV